MSGPPRIGFSTPRLSNGRVTRVHGKTRDQKAYHHQRMRLVRNEINLVPSKKHGMGGMLFTSLLHDESLFLKQSFQGTSSPWGAKECFDLSLAACTCIFQGGLLERWLGVVM